MKDTSHDVGSHESLDFQGENIPTELVARQQERPRSLVELI